MEELKQDILDELNDATKNAQIVTNYIIYVNRYLTFLGLGLAP